MRAEPDPHSGRPGRNKPAVPAGSVMPFATDGRGHRLLVAQAAHEPYPAHLSRAEICGDHRRAERRRNLRRVAAARWTGQFNRDDICFQQHGCRAGCRRGHQANRNEMQSPAGRTNERSGSGELTVLSVWKDQPHGSMAMLTFLSPRRFAAIQLAAGWGAGASQRCPARACHTELRLRRSAARHRHMGVAGTPVRPPEIALITIASEEAK